MFPFDLEDEEEIEIEEQKEPKDWEIDFKTGKLTGRVDIHSLNIHGITAMI